MLQISHEATAYPLPVWRDSSDRDPLLRRYAAVLARTLPFIAPDLSRTKLALDSTDSRSLETFEREYDSVRHWLIKKKYSREGLTAREQTLLDLINMELERLLGPPSGASTDEVRALADAKQLIAEAKRGTPSPL